MKKTPFICLLSLVIFCSCRPKPLEIVLPQEDPQVVVFSQLFPGPVITVVLSQTLDALSFSEEEGDTLTESGFQDLLIGGARVSIAYGGQEEFLYSLSDGIYATHNVPQIVDETYTLKVNTPDGRSLSASSQLLPEVDFSVLEPEISRSNQDTLVKVNYEIADLPGENWYLLNFYTNNSKNKTPTNELDSLLEGEGSYLKHTELIGNPSSAINNSSGTIELPHVHASDSLFVSLANISEDYYRYLETRQNASNLFTELTKEPVNSPSNIEGGLGFFNLYFPNIYYFDLGKY